MSKWIVAIAVCIAVLFWMNQNTDQSEGEDILVMGTHPGYAPYESIDSQGEVVGFDVDVAKAIADYLGKELKIIQAPFDTLILGLKEGKSDIVIAGMSMTAERMKEITMIPYHGDEVTEVGLVFWEQIPENANSLESLMASSQATIAVQQGTWQEAFLQQFQGLTLRCLETNTDLIMDVKYQKSAAALFEKNVAQVLQKKVPELQIQTLPLPEEFQTLGVGIGMNKKNSSLSKEVQEAVSFLKETGVIAELEAKWFGEEVS